MNLSNYISSFVDKEWDEMQFGKKDLRKRTHTNIISSYVEPNNSSGLLEDRFDTAKEMQILDGYGTDD
jgi:hypothetical protein